MLDRYCQNSCTHLSYIDTVLFVVLKNSMQPGATNITVQFHLPSYECVFKAPKVIPSVFSGEKLVVYWHLQVLQKRTRLLQWAKLSCND